MAKRGDPDPCLSCRATGCPYLPGQHKAGTSPQLQTPGLANRHRPGALGPPGRAWTECEHGQGQVASGPRMALWRSLAGCGLLSPACHEVTRGWSRLQASMCAPKSKCGGQGGRYSRQERAFERQGYLYACHDSGFPPVQVVEEAREGKAGAQTQQLPRSDGFIHGARLGRQRLQGEHVVWGMGPCHS